MTEKLVFPAEDASEAELCEAFLGYLRFIAEQRAGNPARRLWVHESVEALLLAMAGEPVVVSAMELPSDVEPGPIKSCFRNCFNLSMSHPDYVYAEGYAMAAGLMPVEHAWAVHQGTGAIVDPTWAQLGEDQRTVYLGLKFTRPFMREVLATSEGSVDVLASDYKHRHRALRRGLVLDADGVVFAWGDPPPF